MGTCSARPNHPSETFQKSHPAFTHFIEVAPGFWNYRTDFYVSAARLNFKTHMSVAKLASVRACERARARELYTHTTALQHLSRPPHSAARRREVYIRSGVRAMRPGRRTQPAPGIWIRIWIRPLACRAILSRSMWPS